MNDEGEVMRLVVKSRWHSEGDYPVPGRDDAVDVPRRVDIVVVLRRMVARWIEDKVG
jgi:hypothetical protein